MSRTEAEKRAICMRKVKLHWSIGRPVRVYFDGLKSNEHFRNSEFSELKGFGVYMYLDKDNGEARYVGQAFEDSDIALAS